jgi:uncharacterized protein YbjT (DUF2867 family)
VLLTGASGFVGQHVYPELVARGFAVRCATRAVERASRSEPSKDWVYADLEQPDSLSAALRGCTHALYLVHHMNTGSDYPAREAASATTFREAAVRAGLERIVYLGGVTPSGPLSTHLESRKKTGALLHQGGVPVLELRAGMIVGHGSTSWMMVRDLAKRLPLMLLPRWLEHRSAPVAIKDVIIALGHALEMPLGGPRVLDVPGPEVLTHRELIGRAARAMNRHPAFFSVPVVTPTLSSYWIALVTRVNLQLARELVQGLQSDLLPGRDQIWDGLPGHTPLGLDEAMRQALEREREAGGSSRSGHTQDGIR